MANLIDLSPEILHNLFCFVDAVTLSNLSKTCHQLRDFISRDDLLWRRVYANRFVSNMAENSGDLTTSILGIHLLLYRMSLEIRLYHGN